MDWGRLVFVAKEIVVARSVLPPPPPPPLVVVEQILDSLKQSAVLVPTEEPWEQSYFVSLVPSLQTRVPACRVHGVGWVGESVPVLLAAVLLVHAAGRVEAGAHDLHYFLLVHCLYF
jgi:hypothetical protein